MLKKNYRLTKNGSFNYLYKHGLRQSSSCLRLYFVKGKKTKVGFSVSNKVGNAVTRNLVKRRLRSIVSSLLPQFVLQAQVVLVANQTIVDCNYAKMYRLVHDLLLRANILGS
ncbi:MAG: ribonuclease P protein component [Clostridiales bacterium]|jgi:ribonuclease P protein component|nr:ribonuclease P protein component [Clostridiales bacterium]